MLVISSVRIYLVVYGQWATDGSWAYDPMLAIETSEIGGTLIALSIPALKPLFGSLFSHLGTAASNPNPKLRGPQHNGNGHDTSRRLQSGRTGRSSIQLNLYHAQIASREGRPTSLAVNAKDPLEVDGSSDNLLLD